MVLRNRSFGVKARCSAMRSASFQVFRLAREMRKGEFFITWMIADG
jgi:hypothetical protein